MTGGCCVCNTDDCAASLHMVRQLRPGTPVRVTFPASDGRKPLTGRVYGVPSVGVTHWFIGVAVRTDRYPDGHTATEISSCLPAEYARIIGEERLPADVRGMSAADCTPWSTGLDAERLGWTS